MTEIIDKIDECLRHKIRFRKMLNDPEVSTLDYLEAIQAIGSLDVALKVARNACPLEYYVVVSRYN